jgi:lipoprotein-anchoring transpeptidase ErfK/SrfK
MRSTARHRPVLALALLVALAASGCASSASAQGPGHVREAGVRAAGVAADPQAAGGGPPEVVVNVPAGELTLYRGGQAVATYPVTVGTPRHPTPIGEFELTRAIWNPWWHPPKRAWARNRGPQPPGPNNAMGRVKVYFKPLYFLHGTAETEDLGQPASHGCIRLSNQDIIALARALHAHATPDLEPRVLDALESDPKETQEIGFENPVPLRVVYERVEIEGDRLVVHPDVYGRDGKRSLARNVEKVLAERGLTPREEQLDEVARLFHQESGSVALAGLLAGGDPYYREGGR